MQGLQLPDLLAHGLCWRLGGGATFCSSLAVFPPTFTEEILVYYILADLENRVRHFWWPSFFQPNPTLCLPPQQTSAPPSRALGHAKFSASFLSKKCLDIKWFFIVLNCQVVEWVDFFCWIKFKNPGKSIYILDIYTFPIYRNLYVAPLSVVQLVYGLLTVVLLLFKVK